MDKYFTIQSACQSIYKERKSTFYGKLYYIAQLEEVKEIQKKLKKEFHDAVHYCYVYRCISDNKKVIEYWSDYGEPTNTAGLPILNELRKYYLVNELAVVIRYYGGIKLDTSGLIKAYSETTKLAVENAIIFEKQVTISFINKCKYEAVNRIMQLFKKYSAEIVNKEISETCYFSTHCPQVQVEQLQNELTKSQIQILNYA